MKFTQNNCKGPCCFRMHHQKRYASGHLLPVTYYAEGSIYVG